MARVMSVDIETYSSVDLAEAGVYAYAASPDFEVIIIGYAFDDGPVNVHDCTKPGCWPHDFLSALADPKVEKHAFNANFERTCLSAALEGEMPPEQWKDTMVKALELGLPRSLAGVGEALGLPEDKAKDRQGKALIQYFSKPCKPTKANGGRTRNLPEHDPDKWALYLEYNRQDVVAEREISRILDKYRVSDAEWDLWNLDQKINDNGVRADMVLAQRIIDYNEKSKERMLAEAKGITGLNNPNNLAQLKPWLASQGVHMESVTKETIADALAKGCPDNVRRVLEIRQSVGKTSIAKYDKIITAACPDGRLRGMFQFYGARSGRWTGRVVQLQNLARNAMDDLDLARELAREGDFETLEAFFGNPSQVFSELVRTALIPSEGCRFVVSDFSAIEARVIAWVAGEKWRMEAFAKGKDIYCESASRAFGVPVVKHGVNGHLRAQGKVMELALGYQGGVGAMKAMDRGGAIPEEEMPEMISKWRSASPKITKLWYDMEGAAKKAIKYKKKVLLHPGISFSCNGDALFMSLPSKRFLAYRGAKLAINKKGFESITYMGTNQTTRKWEPVETYGGKLVENCLAGETKVVTNRGIIQLLDVTDEDLLWDGSSWVCHDGVIFKGVRKTVNVDGVNMTPDHRILTEGGWKSASQSERYYRRNIRLPDGYQLQWVGREEVLVANKMPVRKRICNGCKRIYEEKAKVLRMQKKRNDISVAQKARNVRNAHMECLALYEREMPKPECPSMAQLRRPRDYRLQKMGRKLRELLCRHAGRLQAGADIRQDRCERELRAEKLPVGIHERAGKEQTGIKESGYAMGADHPARIVGENRNRRDNAPLSFNAWVDGRYAVAETGRFEPVYDIKNAGAKHRFTIMSDAGPMVVHNCIQAIARDCLALAMKRVDDLGYKIVMHIHDEMVVDVPKSNRDAPGVITAAMAMPVPWAPGLLLKGETYEADFYQKD